MFSWRRNFCCLILIVAPFLGRKKRFAIFQLSFYFCVCCVFLFFLLSVLFFQVSFILSEFFQTKKKPLKESLSRNTSFLKLCFILNIFWRRGTPILIEKNWSKNYHLNFLQKKKLTFEEKKIYFKIHTRWGSRARLNALLTIAACRDVVGRVKSHVHSVVIDLVFSVFFFSFYHYFLCFLLFFFFFLCFSFFGCFFIVSLCFRCLHLFLYLLQILFLLCFWFLGHVFLFSVGWGLLFFSPFSECSRFFFQKSFFFSLCVLFCFRCLWLFQTKLQFSCLCVRFLFKKFQSFFVKLLFFECPFSNTIFPFCMCLQLCKTNLFSLFFSFLVRWRKGSKNTRPEIWCLFSLPLSHPSSFFTFFTICFFGLFCCSLHHQKKSIEIVFLFVFLTIFFSKKKTPTHVFSLFLLN